MRVSTADYFSQSIAAMQRQQAQVLKTQSQLSSNLKLQTAADNPAGAAQGLSMDQALAANAQYTANAQAVSDRLSLTDGALSAVNDSLSSIRERVLQANSAAISDADRQTLAKDVRQSLQQLLANANAQDGQGRYLFAGSQDGQAPFSLTAGVTSYRGDDLDRNVAIGAARVVQDGNNGRDVFLRGGDLFATVSKLADLLDTPTSADPAAKASAQAELTAGLSSLQSAQDRVADLRASVGIRLQASDDAQSQLSAQALQLKSSLSNLRDVDYAEAASRLTQQLTGLQAAQQTFAKVQSLSLFNYIK